MKKLSSLILKWLGWKIIVEIPDLKKCVICVAPHTSNWDFLLGKLAYLSIGRFAGFLIKKDWFVFPFNLIFKVMGGIPVNRSRSTNMVDQIVRKFNENEEFCVAITPEGTRKKNPHWKKGFYHIALKAKVPIVLAYFDYSRKEIGFRKIITPSGNEAEDMAIIKDYYKDFKGKNPENFTI